MKAVIQRVKEARVRVEREVVGEIGRGLLDSKERRNK